MFMAFSEGDRPDRDDVFIINTYCALYKLFLECHPALDDGRRHGKEQ